MHSIVEKLLHGVIVSVQAFEDSPLYGADHMKIMAQCAALGHASGFRACWPQDIRAVRSITDLPIVGINKKFKGGNPLDEIFITPDFASACEVIEAGCDVLGIDCTIRPSRGFDALYILLKQIKEQYPTIAIMADLATVEEGIRVANTGLVDIISSTLCGYTRQSLGAERNGPDLSIIKSLKASIDLPINGEGRIWELKDLEEVLHAGADMVTIGTAITRPQLITERFVNCNTQYRQAKG